MKRTGHRHARVLGAVSITLFLALIGVVLVFPSLQQLALRSPQIAAIITAVLVDITNTDRAKETLSPLTINPTLVAIAQMKANDMAEKGYFAHTSPEGLDPWYWFRQGGYDYRFAGENLAVNFADSAQVSSAWMASPKHRENILDGRFTEIGIATAQGTYEGRTTTFVVQIFGTPRAEAVTIEPAEETTVVPDNPDTIAFASNPAAPSAVLSERNEALPAPSGGSRAVATTEPAVAAALAESTVAQEPSLLSYFFGYPERVVEIAFYILGLLLALSLVLEVWLEVRKGHRTHFIIAASILTVVVVGFVAVDQFLFVTPLVV